MYCTWTIQIDLPVQLLSVLNRLQVLTALWRVVVLQVGFNRLVLLVEEGKVGDKVFDDVHYINLLERCLHDDLA